MFNCLGPSLPLRCSLHYLLALNVQIRDVRLESGLPGLWSGYALILQIRTHVNYLLLSNCRRAYVFCQFTPKDVRPLGNTGLSVSACFQVDAGWDGIAYCHSFDTQPGVWQTVFIPFKDFIPVFR